MSRNIIVNENNGILEVVFNRPESKNAINREMFEILLSVFNDAQQNSNLRAIFLSGNGDSFSAGGDVKDMVKDDSSISLQEKTNSLKRIMNISRLLHEGVIPTVAVINGVAAGAGFALALACDLRIASENAKFTTAFSKIGFSGDFGGSYFLTQIIGTAKAKELFYFSEMIDASSSKKMGIINHLKKTTEIDDFSESLKEKFRSLPPIALRYMKKNLNNALLGNLNISLDDEALNMMICSETEDHKSAVKAFINKSKPTFKGK